MPHRSSLCQMVSMVRNGAVSPVELVEAHLRQIARRNPALNAFVTVMADRALAEARAAPPGPLHGVPITVKDSFDIAGMPTHSGSRVRAGHCAAADAAAVARMRAAGAIVLGRTNTPELLANYETDNFITGRTNNPWDLDRTPGGSSGGEAAAIAAFCSPGGLASDGGGSIRVPAHFCGIAGLKPTPGRVPGAGHFPSLGYPAGLLTTVGPMARSAEDLRLLFPVLAGSGAREPRSNNAPRIGLWERFYSAPVRAEIIAAVQRAGALLEGLGLAVSPFEPRGLERAPNVWAFLFSQCLAAATRKLIAGREREAHWTLLETLSTREITTGQLLLNLAARDNMRASLLHQMENTDVLLMPVCGITAFRHRERNRGSFQAMMPAVLANVLGLPAVAVPIARSQAGLPIGVQLMGRPYEDEGLLELAVRLEEAAGA